MSRADVVETFSVKNLLAEKATIYGEMDLIKIFPEAKWGDVVRANKRTGASFTGKERSQIFTIKFPNPVPLKSIIDEFNALPEVEYAEPPVIISTFEDPNDPYYFDGSNPQWYFENIEASAGWDITHGSSSVRIGIVDTGTKQDHDDLDTKIVGGDGLEDDLWSEHGTGVASAAAAKTNNTIDVAGIGWNTSLYTYKMGNGIGNEDITANKLYLAARYCDIINCSWGTYYYPSKNDLLEIGCPVDEVDDWVGRAIAPYSYQIIEDEIEDAIISGVIVVAAAGNGTKNFDKGIPADPSWDPHYPPYPAYPAQYNGVIAISGSRMDSGSEVFVSYYNYGSFIDFCSPSYEIYVANYSGGTPHLVAGTSFGSPIAAGLTSLIIAKDPNEDVYEILKEGNDNIDQTLYPDNANGWNNRTGYGRINMRKALEAVFPEIPSNLHISGSVGQHPTLYWNANSESDLDGYKIYQKIGSGSVTLRTTVGSGTTSFTDNGVAISNSKFDPIVTYWVSAYDLAGNESDKSNPASIKGTDFSKKSETLSQESTIPDKFMLYPAYPNPFNPRTTFSFDLAKESNVQFRIYNQVGNLVWETTNTHLSAGSYTQNWNGLNIRGISVASGIYYVTLTAGDHVFKQKISLLK